MICSRKDVKMLKKGKKITFTNILKLIKQFDTALGIFLYKPPDEKKTSKEKCLSMTLSTFLTMITVLVVSTLIVTKFALINFIFSCSVFSIAGSLCVFVAKINRNKTILKDLLDWCEGLYNLEKSFVEVVQQTAATHLIAVEKRTSKLLKWLRIVMYVDVLFITFGLAFIGLFLSEDIHPKFGLPIPFYLPFKKQESWLAFITTIFWIVKCAIDTATIIVFVFGMFFCIALHILGFLDIIKDIVEKMKEELKMNQTEIDEDEQSSTMKSNSIIQVKPVAIINESAAFHEWTKIITEMICNVNTTISSFSKLYTEFFLLLEIASLASLFICGLTFIVTRQQYFYAVGVTFPTFLLFCICYINEKILEKFDDIKQSFYDMPWYGLAIQERKIVMMLMQCDQIQKGFTAAGIHSQTLERFWLVLKTGYSNVLVLRDLVMK